MSVLVTSGATVPFPQLVETVLDPQVLSTLEKLNYSTLTVQFGNGYEQEFDKLLSKVSTTLNIRGVAYLPDIESDIKQHTLVISHAGTGSILDSLRLSKPLIVVINTTLSNNHQLEIAQILEGRGNLIKIFPNATELCDALKSIKETKLSPLENPVKEEFQRHLDSL